MLSKWSPHPSHHADMRTYAVIVICLGVIQLLAWLLPPATTAISAYLPLHTLFETISIVVSGLVFTVGWTVKSQRVPGNIVILACMFFAVGWLDFFHTISYVGMPEFITPNDSEKHLAFWLSARLLASLALLLVAVRSWEPRASARFQYAALSAVTALTALIFWVVISHQDILPRTFIVGHGLTPLKKNVEYVIIAINLITAWALWRQMQRPQIFNAAALFGAVCVMAQGEFFFTLYTTMTGAYNVLGHAYKVLAYLIVYRALVVATIERPYVDLLASQRQLQASQENLSITLESIGDAVVTTDPLGSITRMNPAAERLTGWALGQALGQPLQVVFRMVDAQTRAPSLNPVQAAIDHGAMVTMDHHTALLGRGGEEYQISVSAAPIRNPLKQIAGVVLVCGDVSETYRANEALQQKTQMLSESQRIARIGSWSIELGSGKVTWSTQTYLNWGVSPESHSPTVDSLFTLAHPDDHAAIREWNRACLAREAPADFECRVTHADGSVRVLSNRGTLVLDEDGLPLRVVGTVQDISERKRTQEALHASLLEKTALLKEVHHRVKNNLQVITSLLRLESRRSSQPDTKAALGDMQGRIRSMALLHETLYRSGTLASIDLGNYLQQLSSQVFRAQLVQTGAVQLRLNLASLQVGMDQATPCGLLVNELVSNCLKHGFPQGLRGEVRIELQPTGEGSLWRLSVADTGVGLPGDFEQKRQASLGLQLVGDLSQQLEGQWTIGAGAERGAVFTLTFTPVKAAALLISA